MCEEGILHTISIYSHKIYVNLYIILDFNISVCSSVTTRRILKLSPEMGSLYPFNNKICSIILMQFMCMLNELAVN